MKYVYRINIALLLLFIFSVSSLNALDYHPRRLIVKFKTSPSSFVNYKNLTNNDNLTIKPIFTATSQALSARRYSKPVYLFTFRDEKMRLAAEATLAQDNNIEYVERDYKFELFNDPLYHQQWGLENNGQDYLGIERISGGNNDTIAVKTGLAGADINIKQAIEASNSKHTTILAIIDTGVDYKHPDLEANIWHNPFEIPDNNIDDDFNGLVDDVVGYDFSGDETDLLGELADNDPADDIGHGTHCAGIAAAVSGNGIGVEGIAKDVKVICLKIFPNGFASVIAPAIAYAVDNGAEVINASWGSPYYSSILAEMVTYANDNGVLFVAASGNTGESDVFYPAKFEETLTVGASNSNGEVTYFSTYGDWIDLVAPGRDILSLRAGNTDLYASSGEPEVRIIDEYYYLSDGTSMAAPHVTGAAALILSYSPALTLDSLKKLLFNTADDIIDPFPGKDIYSGWGQLNVGRAVSMLSGSYAEIAQPQINQIIAGDVLFYGSAFSDFNGDYTLRILPDNSDLWIPISSGNANLANEQIVNWNSNGYNGNVMAELMVDGELIYETSFRLINEPEVKITFPQDGDTVSSFAEIIGSVWMDDLQYYQLTFSSDAASNSPFLIESSTELIYENHLANWSVGLNPPGTGILKLDVQTASGTFSTEINLYIKTLLAENYPLGNNLKAHLTAVAGNIDDDPEQEVLFGSNENIIINDFSNHEIRTLQTDFATSYYSALSLYDFTNNGKDEIVVVTDSGVVIMDGSGNLLAGWPQKLIAGNLYNSLPTPLISDIDNDGEMEILIITQGGEIYCWRADGESYFHSRDGIFVKLDNSGLIRTWGGAYVPYLFAYDFDSDGYKDVGTFFTAKGNDGGYYLFSGKNALPLYPEKGARLFSAKKIFGGLMADFDADNEPEIALTYWYDDKLRMGVSIIEADGTPLAGWPQELDDKIQWLTPYPAAGDLDGDGSPELVCTFSALDGGEVYIWHSDGTAFLENPFGVSDGILAEVVTSLASPLIVDIDNDQEYEIVSRGGALFFGKNERYFAWELDGSQSVGWPIYTNASPSSVFYSPYTPVAGDFDNDGLLELVTAASDRKIYSWNLPTVVNESTVLWGTFLHNNQRTGLLPIQQQNPLAIADPKSAPLLMQNYPNPFNAETIIQISVEVHGQLIIEVVNGIGQRVKMLYDDPIDAGIHKLNWDGTNSRGQDVASGVYFLRARLDENSLTKKMILLR